jgi:putative membrane-bound dehydrogenase-like protein
MSHRPGAWRLAVSALFLIAFTPASLLAQGRPPDREYVLEAHMLGYRGMGGAIDGVRNPTLTALTGETVRITIVNGEVMVHDVAMEKLNVRSTQILERGVSTSITFVAKGSDTYYCTVPGHRAAGMQGLLLVSDKPREEPPGVLPQADGKPLDLGFESGTLEGWKVEGDAFDVVNSAAAAAAAGDQAATPSNQGQAGQYFVTSRVHGSARKGTLSSPPFTVTQPFASFRVAGGAFGSTRVELVLLPENKVVFTMTGANHGRLRPVVADLTPWVGQQILVRLVDAETGAPTAVYLKESPWAHISFDDFRFHAARPEYLNELVASEVVTMPPMDVIEHAGLSGRDAAKAMTVPKGFSVKLGAAEPDIVRPIAFAIDDRGRLWVAEAHTYPTRAHGPGKDRILIFEDTNGDGSLDRRKVFIENLNLVSGLEVGFGGVWVGAAPYLLFIPIKPGADVPAGPPQILLDGWGYEDTHETLNTFIWGPDGWLYGTHGVFTHSNVGRPGTPASQRQRLNAAIWRYHPIRHEFEVFAHGTSNPWGVDFNDYGHAFSTACVIEHLFHIIPGARYKRQSGQHFNPYTYDDIETAADHVHWVGQQGPHAGNGRSGSAGGGHAHAGAMIYLGGDTWPREYREAIFMNNIHGARTNMDRLERAGSGYVASHGPDFLLANDAHSQMLNLRYGPDGSVWAIDWYDRNQCHSTTHEIHQTTFGRIFKITHEGDRWSPVDLSKLPSEKLVELQLHRNDWYVRHARRLLQERGPDPKVHAQLKAILRDNPDVTRRLRALWALHVTLGLDHSDLVALLDDENEYVRAWAIQLLAETWSPSDAAVRRLATLAREDASPLVRLYIASSLQRTPVEKRWEVLEGLYAHDGDASDHNLPLMVWYAAEPAVEFDMPRALSLAADSKLPNLFAYTVQRIAAAGGQDALRVLTDRLGRTTDPVQQKQLAEGIVKLVGATGAVGAPGARVP